MAHPVTPSETFVAIGEWRHPTDPSMIVTIYHVNSPGRLERFESWVYLPGDTVEKLTAPTWERLMQMIEQQYDGSVG